MLIIPAIDIIDNSVVRLTEGKYDEVKKYDSTPIEQAKLFNEHGFEWLHVIDLIASRDGSINIKSIINEIKSQTNLKLEFGGGVRSFDDVSHLIEAGVDRVIIGSMSVNDTQDFELAAEKYGADKIVVASDVLDKNIQIKGWTENSGVKINDHINYCLSIGLNTFLVTDIEKDGLLQGPSFELYRELLCEFPDIKLIASGGVSNMDDLEKLNEINCYAAVVGKAIYENKVEIKELAQFGS
jgi:phosphoribosylformimino-5-aminoimidazole carboxamide ribotide isomerase